jgi:hypothetical protein
MGLPRLSVTLKYNSIYYFRYKSELAKQGKLHIYDQNPLVIFLDLERKDGKVLGINFHWIQPPRFRKLFLQEIERTFTEQMIKEGKKRRSPYFPRLFYKNIKSNQIMKKMSYQAIRLYFIKNIGTIKEISREDFINLFTTRYKTLYKKRTWKSSNYPNTSKKLKSKRTTKRTTTRKKHK